MSMATMENIREQLAPKEAPGAAMDMKTVSGFEGMQRAAKLFASSTIVPQAYRGSIANCFIAVDMAMRMGANPLMVMQNLYIVHGNPAWSAQFLIATFNRCGRFSAIRYQFQGREGDDDWGCRALATELASGGKLEGPLITIGLAKKEGWHDKPGSKWRTIPEMMLRYRAAAWLVRAYAPEIAMGLHTVEEVRDAVIPMEPDSEGVFEITLDDVARQAEAERPEQPAEGEKTPKREEAKKKDYGDISCPLANADGSPRIVEAEDCERCGQRKGCPNWEQA